MITPEYSSHQTNQLHYPETTSISINSGPSSPQPASISGSTMSNLQSNLSDFVTVNYNGLIGINATDPFKITTEARMFSLPLGIQILMCLMYGTLTFTAVASNMIVCYIVLSSQKMRTATNYFIVNLAVGDILMALLCIPFTFPANLIFEYWPFGLSLCIIVSYSQANSVFISAYTMVAISIDKYMAIMYPMRLRMPKNQAKMIILVIWSAALLTSLPTAILSRLVPAGTPDSATTPPAPTTPSINIPTSIQPNLRATTATATPALMETTQTTTPFSVLSSPLSTLSSSVMGKESALLKKESLISDAMTANEIIDRPNLISNDIIISQLEQQPQRSLPDTIDRTTATTLSAPTTTKVMTTTTTNSTTTARTIPSSQMNEKEQQREQNFCQEIWSFWPVGKYYYSMALMILQFVLPLFVLVITYTRIVIIVWGKRMPGEEDNARDARMARSKRKMIKMVIFCVIAFALTWMPFNALILIGDVYNEIWEYPNIMYIWFITHYLAMCHTITNPLIYIWMNNRFRAGFKQVIGDIYGLIYRFFAFVCCFCVCFACCLNCSRKKYGQLIVNFNRKRGASRAPLNSSGSVNIYANSNHHHHNHHYNHNGTSNSNNNNGGNNYNGHGNKNNGSNQKQQQQHQRQRHSYSATGGATTTSTAPLAHNSTMIPSNRNARNFNSANEQRSINKQQRALCALERSNSRGGLALSTATESAGGGGRIELVDLKARAAEADRGDNVLAAQNQSANSIINFTPKIRRSSVEHTAEAAQQTKALRLWRPADEDGGESKRNCDSNRTNTPRIDSNSGAGRNSNVTTETTDADEHHSCDQSQPCCSSSPAQPSQPGADELQQQQQRLDDVKARKTRVFFLSKQPPAPARKKRRSKKHTHSISLQMTTSEIYKPSGRLTNNDNQKVPINVGSVPSTAADNSRGATKTKSNDGLSSAVRRAARELRKLTSLSSASNCPTCRNNGDNLAATSSSWSPASCINNVFLAENKKRKRVNSTAAAKSTGTFVANQKDAAARPMKFVSDTLHQSSISTATNSAQTNITSLAMSLLSSAGGGPKSGALAAKPTDDLEAAMNNSNTSASSFSNAENGITGTCDTRVSGDKMSANHFGENNLNDSMVLPASHDKSKQTTSTFAFGAARSSCSLDETRRRSAANSIRPQECQPQMTSTVDKSTMIRRQLSLDGLPSFCRKGSGGARMMMKQHCSPRTTIGSQDSILKGHHVATNAGARRVSLAVVNPGAAVDGEILREQETERTNLFSSAGDYVGETRQCHPMQSSASNSATNSTSNAISMTSDSDSEQARRDNSMSTAAGGAKIGGGLVDHHEPGSPDQKDNYCARHRQPTTTTAVDPKNVNDEQAFETDEDVCDEFGSGRLNAGGHDFEHSGDEDGYDDDDGEPYDEEAEELELDYGDADEEQPPGRGDGAMELMQFKNNQKQQQQQRQQRGKGLELGRQMQEPSSAVLNGPNIDLKRHFRRLLSLSTGDELHRHSGGNGFHHHYYAIRQQQQQNHQQQQTESADNLSRRDENINAEGDRGSLGANENGIDIEIGDTSDKMVALQPQSICRKQNATYKDSHFLLSLQTRAKPTSRLLLSNSANSVIRAEEDGEEYEIMVINSGGNSSNDNNNKELTGNSQQRLVSKLSITPTANDESAPPHATAIENVDLTTFKKSHQRGEAKKRSKQQANSIEAEQEHQAEWENNFNDAGGLKNRESGGVKSVDENKMAKVTSTSTTTTSFGKPFEHYNQAHGNILAAAAAIAKTDLKQTGINSSETTTTTICNQSSSAPNSETKKVCHGNRRPLQQHQHQQAQPNGPRPGQIRLSGAYSMPAHFYQLPQQTEASERKLEVEV